MGIVELTVGHETFRAQTISDVCRDEGIRNELLLRDHPYAALRVLPHVMMVEDDDLDQAQQIIADFFVDSVPKTPVPTWMRIVVAVLLVIPALGGIAWQIFRAIF